MQKVMRRALLFDRHVLRDLQRVQFSFQNAIWQTSSSMLCLLVRVGSVCVTDHQGWFDEKQLKVGKQSYFLHMLCLFILIPTVFHLMVIKDRVPQSFMNGYKALIWSMLKSITTCIYNEWTSRILSVFFKWHLFITLFIFDFGRSGPLYVFASDMNLKE